MIGPGGQVRVFGYPHPCDMRKSFNTLSGLVASMGHDIARGDVFAFVSRNRKRAKVLWYDGRGLSLLAKRLDEGGFAPLWQHSDDIIELTMNELSLLLEGCKLIGRIPLSPPVSDLSKKTRLLAGDFL